MTHNEIDLVKANINREDRFVDRNVSQFLKVNRTPIEGYLDYLLCSLEESVKPIVPSISSLSTIVPEAKHLCNKTSNLLTHDESAAIYLYTMQTIFYEQLNTALRAENREALKCWFSFIRLIMSGLEKLPDVSGETIWRGIAQDNALPYSEKATFIWWSFNSCTKDLKVIQPYVGLKGTIFAIECKRAKDISDFSAFRDEVEVLLLPGTGFHVKSSSLLADKWYMVHLKEIQNEQQATTTTAILTTLPSFVEAAADAAVQHFNKQFKWKRYSSLHTYLDLVNNSDVALRLEVSDVNEDHWDGVSRPRNRFHNVKIPSHDTLKERLEIKAKSNRATSSMIFKQDGGDNVVFYFRTDQWAARAPEKKSEEIVLQNGWKAKVTVGMDGGETLQYQFSKI